MALFNVWTFVITIINLLVLYFILKRLLFKPVTKFLEDRENKIKSSLEEADKERQEAYSLKAKYEELLKNADNEGKAIIEKAQKAAEDKANKIIENANKEAENIIEKAKEEAMLEKIKAMHDLRTEISQLVIDAASRVLKKKLPVADEDLINEVIEEAGGIMAQLIAKRYAYAFFDVAKQRNKVKEYYEELNKAIEIFQVDKVKRIFKNKSIDKAKKMEFVEQILKDTDKEVINFIKIIISKHREGLIEDIGKEFKKLYKEHFNIADVKVVSAYPLKEEVLQKLQEKLEKKLERHINIEPIVDKSILGGLKLIIGNTIIDGSVKARLTALLKNMQQAV